MEEIETEIKNVLRYILVGAHSKEVIEKEEISSPKYWWDYGHFYNKTQIRNKRRLLTVGGEAITGQKTIKKDATQYSKTDNINCFNSNFYTFTFLYL